MSFILLCDIEDWCQDQMEQGYTKVLSKHIPEMINEYKQKKCEKLIKEEMRYIKKSIAEHTDRLKFLETELKK